MESGADHPGPSPADAATVESLRRENAALRARVAELERRLNLSPVGAWERPAAPPVSPPTAPPGSPPASPSSSPPSLPTLESPSLEQFIGRRIVPLVGGVAVLVAVGILVHYAIDLGLFGKLPPAGRFTLGLSIGLALLGLGEFVRRRGAPGASVGLDAAGIGSVLASIALGVFSLRLFGPATGAALAGAAGVLGAAWSLRTRSETVGIAALLGIFVLPAVFGTFSRNGAPILGGLLVALGIATGLAMHLVAGNAFVRVRLYVLVAGVVTGALAILQFDDRTMSSAFALLWWGLFVASAVLCAMRGTGIVGVFFGGRLGPSPMHANGAVVAVASVPLVFLQGLGGRGGGVVDVVDLLPLVAGGLLAGLALFLRGFGSVVPDQESNEDDAELARAIASEPADSPEAARAIRVRATTAASRALVRDFEALAILLGTLGAGFVATDPLRPAIFALGAAAALAIGSRLARPLVAAMACLLSVVAIGSILIDGLAFFDAPEVGRFAVPFSGGTESVVLHASPAVVWGFGAAAIMLGAGILVGRGFVASWLGVFGSYAWILASIALCHRVGPVALIAIAGAAVALMRGRREAGAAAVASATSFAILGFLVWLGFVIGAHFSTDWRSAAGLGWEYVPMAAALVLAAMRLTAFAAPAAPIRLLPLAVATLLAGAGLALLSSLGVRDAGAGRFEAALAATIGLAVAAMVVAALGRSLANAGLAGAGALLAVLSAALASILGLGVLLDGAPGSVEWPALALGSIVAVGGAAYLAHDALRRTSFAGRTAVVAAAAASVAPLGALAIASLSGDAPGAWLAGGWIVAVGVAELAVGFRSDRAALRWAGLATFGLLVLRLYLVDLAQSPVLVRVALLFVAGMALVGTGIVYARRAAARKGPAAVPSPRADGETPASGVDRDRSA